MPYSRHRRGRAETEAAKGDAAQRSGMPHPESEEVS